MTTSLEVVVAAVLVPTTTADGPPTTQRSSDISLCKQELTQTPRSQFSYLETVHTLLLLLMSLPTTTTTLALLLHRLLLLPPPYLLFATVLLLFRHLGAKTGTSLQPGLTKRRCDGCARDSFASSSSSSWDCTYYCKFVLKSLALSVVNAVTFAFGPYLSLSHRFEQS